MSSIGGRHKLGEYEDKRGCVIPSEEEEDDA